MAPTTSEEIKIMSEFTKVKRATIGQLVKADVTGMGDWVTGKILSFDKTFITFKPADGTEDVKIVRDEVFKASKEEIEEVKHAAAMSLNDEVQAKIKATEKAEVKAAMASGWVTTGQMVKANTPVGGEQWVGRIVSADEISVFIQIAGGHDVIKVGRDGILKASKKEFEIAAGDSAEELVVITKKTIDASKYDYVACVAASGKSSKDNNDEVALQLRGRPLDFAYETAAEHLEVCEDFLRAKYKHLNPGQQRMCLGNRIRGKKVEG